MWSEGYRHGSPQLQTLGIGNGMDEPVRSWLKKHFLM
jgi:hypothetical protein